MYMDRLLKGLKKEVKQIMEEAVTKKFIHEDSGSITSLCAAVERCLAHGLKRRALGLFKSNSTTALLHKVAKTFQPAASISQMVVEIETIESIKRSRSSSGSDSSTSTKMPTGVNSVTHSKPSRKYLWIRLALVEKHLAKIISYIVENNSKYYEKEALIAHADYGSIFSSLLVGPCALDFSKLKTGEHYLWTDPRAEELVQRNKIQSNTSPPVKKRPTLHSKGYIGLTSSEDSLRSKEYVESLHQNRKSTLLYGKNNVLVTPKDAKHRLAGYLSLHQYGKVMSLKWTPNRLMDTSVETPCHTGFYWEYATDVLVHEIVYLHCHQDLMEDWIVLVGQDGVQRPPFHFPRGGHLLSFLSCLENGLLPHAQLDPPLAETIHTEADKNESTQDYVFRVVTRYCPKLKEVLEESESTSQSYSANCSYSHNSTSSSAIPVTTSSLHSISFSTGCIEQSLCNWITEDVGEPIQVAYERMRRQIISRAFYGWLSHCRHLKTVRKHLLGLVQDNAASVELPDDASGGLTEEKWNELLKKGVDMNELYRYVYFGGVVHSLRPKLWPILLKGCVPTAEDKLALEKEYSTKLSEWRALEALLVKRDQGTLREDVSTSSYKPATNPECSDHGSSDNTVQEVASHWTTCILTDSTSITQQAEFGEHWTAEPLEALATNLHRIDKDVRRCDRNHWYFTQENLDKLRNVVCTYVWGHIELGYLQGMCDLAAPFLVVFDDEVEAYGCFLNLMKRMSPNFPCGEAMDTKFAKTRSLLQVLDRDLFTLIQQNGDYTHLYFCYRWFLLDFKREFCYSDMFLVWETIWAAQHIASNKFELFLALALLHYYRDIILSNSMDFTDAIKFFNEMAERHDAQHILKLARGFVLELQTLIGNN